MLKDVGGDWYSCWRDRRYDLRIWKQSETVAELAVLVEHPCIQTADVVHARIGPAHARDRDDGAKKILPEPHAKR